MNMIHPSQNVYCGVCVVYGVCVLWYVMVFICCRTSYSLSCVNIIKNHLCYTFRNIGTVIGIITALVSTIVMIETRHNIMYDRSVYIIIYA